MKIYIILEDNGYDAVNPPHNYVFYLTEAEAQKDADALNKAAGNRRDYFSVEELDLKTK